MAVSSVAEARDFPASLALPAEVVEIAATLERAGYETWAVGGALRDMLLGEGESDVDLATAAPPETVQSLFRHTVAVGISHGTVGVLDRHRRLHEVTTFRRDVETDGRHAVVSYGVSLQEDLARRDFTINAIAYHPIRHEWADPFGGREDLGRGVVRAVGVAVDRFREDYLRILAGSVSRPVSTSRSSPGPGPPAWPRRRDSPVCRRNGCATSGSRGSGRRNRWPGSSDCGGPAARPRSGCRGSRQRIRARRPRPWYGIRWR